MPVPPKRTIDCDTNLDTGYSSQTNRFAEQRFS